MSTATCAFAFRVCEAAKKNCSETARTAAIPRYWNDVGSNGESGFSSIDNKNAGLLLRGSFDPKEIATELKANGWREESLDGHKVYVNAADYVAMPASNAPAFLSGVSLSR